VVGESKYLQNLDILNVVVPATLHEVAMGKWQGIVIHFDGKDVSITLHYHKYIYKSFNSARCPCPVLQAAIAYSSTLAAANHAASALQIDALFCVNDMILEVVAVDSNHIKAAIISPPVQMGEIMQYEKDFVAERVCEYICLL